jgi:hypothetical protein
MYAKFKNLYIRSTEMWIFKLVFTFPDGEEIRSPYKIQIKNF